MAESDNTPVTHREFDLFREAQRQRFEAQEKAIDKAVEARRAGVATLLAGVAILLSVFNLIGLIIKWTTH